MFNRIAIILGSIALAALAVGALFFYLTGGIEPKTANDLLLQTAYLSKSKESYARCYNSINYGTSLIGDVRLQIKGENFNNDSITSDRLDTVEKSFMDSVKLECQKTVDDYQQSYDTAVKDQQEIQKSRNVLWSFFFGSVHSDGSNQDVSLFEPMRARMDVAFNEYVFTEQQVKDYFEQELGL